MSVGKTFLQELVPSRLWVYQYIERPFYEGIERVRVAIQGERNGSLKDRSLLGVEDRFIYAVSGGILLTPPINFVTEIFMRNFEIQRVSDEPFLSELYPEKNEEISPRGRNHPSPEEERWLPQVHQMHDPHQE